MTMMHTDAEVLRHVTLIKERRFRTLAIMPDVLVLFFVQLARVRLDVLEGLPPDAVVVGCTIEHGYIVLTLASAAFDQLPEGGVADAPRIDVTFRTRQDERAQ